MEYTEITLREMLDIWVNEVLRTPLSLTVLGSPLGELPNAVRLRGVPREKTGERQPDFWIKYRKK